MKNPMAILVALLFAAVVTIPVNAQKAQREETFRIPYGQSALKLFLRHLPPKNNRLAKPNRVVLFIHGASFPSGLAAGFRFDGHSWMDDLSAAGFDVWALDFLGYGGSDRYPEMSAPADSNLPLGRAAETSKQIAGAVAFITQKQKVAKVSLVAHSWGTMPAALFATQQPERTDRLVLFGPVTLRPGTEKAAEKQPAWWVRPAEAQWERFAGYVPKGEAPVFEKRHFEIWGPAYLASDPTSVSRTPPGNKIPYGPIADSDEAWNGKLAYDPAKILAPTLIARGEWDSVTTDEDAHWLYRAMRNAALKRDVVISRGTHVMHLEESRFQLYREVQIFLEGNDRLKKISPISQTGQTVRRAEMKSSNEQMPDALKQSKSISIAGYSYGDKSLATSPISMQELKLLEKTVTLTEEDKRYLRQAGDVLEDQIDAILDV
ncbi:MAG: alpha/beta fold hydrolase, partial [Blastocatellia bacterium]